MTYYDRPAPRGLDPLGRGLPAKIGLALAVVVAALTVAVAVRAAPIVHLDATISRAALRIVHRHSAILTFFRAATLAGNPLVDDLYCAIAIGCLAVRRHWFGAAVVAVARLISVAAVYLLKLTVDRPRPHPAHPVAHAGGSSFPSGHSTGIATVVALALVGLWITRTGPSNRQLAVGRHVLAAVLVLIALLVAASRVFLDVHYLSDVVAGLTLGALSTCLAVLAVGVAARHSVRRVAARGSVRQ